MVCSGSAFTRFMNPVTASTMASTFLKKTLWMTERFNHPHNPSMPVQPRAVGLAMRVEKRLNELGMVDPRVIQNHHDALAGVVLDDLLQKCEKRAAS